LAQDLDLTAATVSSVVDGLARRGLVARRPSARDRRCITLTVTPIGEAAVAEALARQHAALADVMGALRPEERRALHAAVAGLARAVGVAAGAVPAAGERLAEQDLAD
jgi:DNA-binding MarR family transcriptional regulator